MMSLFQSRGGDVEGHCKPWRVVTMQSGPLTRVHWEASTLVIRLGWESSKRMKELGGAVTGIETLTKGHDKWKLQWWGAQCISRFLLCNKPSHNLVVLSNHDSSLMIFWMVWVFFLVWAAQQGGLGHSHSYHMVSQLGRLQCLGWCGLLPSRRGPRFLHMAVSAVREDQAQVPSTVQASAWVTFANVPPTKANHIIKSRLESDFPFWHTTLWDFFQFWAV